MPFKQTPNVERALKIDSLSVFDEKEGKGKSYHNVVAGELLRILILYIPFSPRASASQKPFLLLGRTGIGLQFNGFGKTPMHDAAGCWICRQ